MNIYAEILKAQKQKKDFALLTVVKTEGAVPRHESSKMLVFADGGITGTIGGGSIEAAAIREAIEAIKSRKNRLAQFDLNKNAKNDLDALCGGCVEVFIEVFNAKPQLVICGAGHVGKALSQMASMLDFEITVIDNRKEWANEERFPEASKIIVEEDITAAIDNLSTDLNTFIIIATWGHKHDKAALNSALKKEARYVGMMGSREKIDEIFKQLMEEGVEKGLLDRVYTPIGLDIRAETPEEIALSIMAEIYMVKNNASGKSMSGTGE